MKFFSKPKPAPGAESLKAIAKVRLAAIKKVEANYCAEHSFTGGGCKPVECIMCLMKAENIRLRNEMAKQPKPRKGRRSERGT